MDKYEYNLKLEEIDKLVDQGDYEEAANLADTIEWRRVRNVRTLCLISEIYEAAGKLDKSKDMLVRAYRKSPVGRNVLYRLVEVTTALGQYDEALEYFAEYVQTAPHDNNRYILKYKIYRGRGSSTEELIAILEEYLGQEYTERWAYELAVLYQEAGQIQKCMATCDDLVLWFHTGKYVKKALEMKKRYAVLTPKQQQIYEICQQEEAQSEYFDDAEEEGTVVRSTDEADGEVLAENIMAETEKKIADEITAQKAEKEKKRQPDASQKNSEQNLLAKVFRKGSDLKRPLKNAKKESGATVTPIVDEKNRLENTTAKDEEAIPEVSGPEMILDAYREEEEPETSEYDDLQVELAKSVRKVISGVARKPELNEEDVPAAVEDRLRDIQEIRERREPEPVPGRLSIDDILLSMGEKGKQAAAVARAEREAEAAKRAETAAAEEVEAPGQGEAEVSVAEEASPVEEAEASSQKEASPVEETEMSGQEEASPVEETEMSGQEEALTAKEAEASDQDKTSAVEEAEALDQEETTAAEEAEASGQAEAAATEESKADSQADESVKLSEMVEETMGTRKDPEESDEPVSSDNESSRKPMLQEPAKSAPVRTITELEAGELSREQLEALKYSDNPEKLLKNRNSLPTYASDTNLVKTRKINTKEELLEAARRELMMTKTIRIPAEEVAKAYSYRTADLSEMKAGSDTKAASRKEEEQNRENEMTAGMSQPGMDARQNNTYQNPTGMPGGTDENPVQTLMVESEEELSHPSDWQEDELSMENSDMRLDDAEEEEPEEYFDDPLTIEPHLRGLFQGFTEIDGLEDQIANAILQVMAKGTDRTSRNGNILIFGAHGAGKTTLAIGLAKAIAQEKGRQTAKMARIYAVDLNRRDIAATIAKIAGGTLIIEEAGDLADNTVEQLTTAMEFRTDGLIVILEDEQRYIHDLLMKHPRFTMKFTAQIYLPVYTADELTMFALRHARKQDYSISEDGFEAIRQKVAEKSSTETPMSVGDIVELVDRAIRNSNKFVRKMSMGKKRYDENDYVLLFAKDFK